MLSLAKSEPTEHETGRARLQKIIRRNSVEFGKFRLASGGESDVFFDMKMTLLDPEGLDLVSELILVIVEFENVDAIGGLIIGACPIIDAVCVKSQKRKPVTGFYVRKQPKQTGTQKMIEGPVRHGANAIIVDDVTTEGFSALNAVRIARDDLGCTVTKVISVVDREQGARENLAAAGLELVSLFTMSDFLKVPHAPVRR